MRGGSFFAALVVLAVGATVALAGTTYRDPVGDVEGGPGPDLVSIALSSTPQTVTFRVRFASAPPLGISRSEGWVDMLLLLVDVAPRGMRQVPGDGYRGVAYAIGVHGPSTKGLVSNQRTRSVVARFPVTRSGRTLTLTVRRRLLGNPSWLRFVAAAGRETEEAEGGGGDSAPEQGVFTYRLMG